MKSVEYDRGKIVYFGTNTEICDTSIMLPGIPLLPVPLLAIFYCLTLIYLFLGISIISDIFMNGIEKITSQKTAVEITNKEGEVIKKK